MLTRTQGWVGVAIIFVTLAAAFHGMNQPFIGTGVSISLALAYGVAFVAFMWWVLFQGGSGGIPVSVGRNPRLFLAVATFGLLALGSGAASITPGVLITRAFGTSGEWAYTVESSNYVVYQKWGPSHCYEIRLVEVTWLTQPGLCSPRSVKAGTRLIFAGKRSFMGTWYETARIAGETTKPLN